MHNSEEDVITEFIQQVLLEDYDNLKLKPTKIPVMLTKAFCRVKTSNVETNDYDEYDNTNSVLLRIGFDNIVNKIKKQYKIENLIDEDEPVYSDFIQLGKNDVIDASIENINLSVLIKSDKKIMKNNKTGKTYNVFYGIDSYLKECLIINDENFVPGTLVQFSNESNIPIPETT